MDINNNQQINTFLKGMNTDVSDALIDSSQYRYAENLRLVTNTDSNEGELRIVEGTGRAYSGPWESIISMTSIRKYVIVIGYTNEGQGLSIYRNDNKGVATEEHPWVAIVDNVPISYFIQEGEDKPHLSLVTRWESEKNIKLYIADGVNSIICLNIMDSYGSSIEDILSYTKTPLKMPSAEIISGGKLRSARVLYAFRLYETGMPATTVSPLSKILSIPDTNNTGYPSEQFSNKGAKITITLPQNDQLDKMQVFRINYVVLGQAPTVSLIYDAKKTSTVFDYGSDIQQVGIDEFLSYIDMPLIPKVIESKADYMLAGNIKYTQDDFDRALYDSGIDFRAYSTGDYDGETIRTYNKQYEYANHSSYNKDFWYIRGYEHAQILGGLGQCILWNYTAKRYYIDKYNTAYDDNDNIITEPIVSLQRGEVYRYGIILYDKDGIKSSVKWIADIKIPEGESDLFDPTHINFPYNLHPDLPKYNKAKNKWEVYTFGIEFKVDIDVIQQQSGLQLSGFEIVRCKRMYTDSYTVTQGIVGITERLKFWKISGSTEEAYQDESIIQNNGFVTTQPLNLWHDQAWGMYRCLTQPDKSTLVFASPEYVYQPDDISSILESERSSIYIQDVQSYYTPMDVGWIVTREQSADGEYSFKTNKFKTVGPFNNKYARLLTVTGDDGVYRIYMNSQAILKTSYFAENDFGWLDSRSNTIHDTCITNVPAIEKIDLPKNNKKINNTGFPEVPNANAFFTEKLASWKDDLTPVGPVSYLGWTCGEMLHWDDEDMYDDCLEKITTNTLDKVVGPISSTGKCIVLKIDGEYTEPSTDMDVCVAPITVASIKKYATPYNGPDSYKTNSPDYYSYGNYVDCSAGGSYITDVFDGDCYLGIFVYHAAHSFNNSVLIGAAKQTTIYYVPVESKIDLKSTFGDLYTRVESRTKSYYIQDVAGSVDGFVLDKDAYMYNTAYNAQPDAVSFSTIDVESKIDYNDFDSRVHHSELKTNNESIDSWTIFKPLNYIDVDSRFGEITNMRLFKDKFLYWLNNATGILSINERTILNDQDENEIVLGTGGVLQRFDYISTLYGMKKNQYEAEVQSNTSQYWWDGHNKEILGYSNGVNLVPLTKVKGLRNYINQHDEQDKPTLVYNPKYDEIISSVVEERSLVFNEKVEFFTSVYGMMPQFRTIVDDTTIVTDQTHLYHMDSAKDSITLLESAGNDIGSVKALPKLQYVVNHNNTYVKVFDISTFGGRFYGGNEGINALTFTFKTPLKQLSTGTGSSLITNREYDFRLDIPRNADSSYGDRMRGKTMQCELKSSSNSGDFSLQYIITKYRMSWS